jgi:putative ABC transport system permease protein
MLYNYLKITIRTLLKYKGYAFINLLGLSMGLTAGILILMYALDEFSFDTFHTKRNRIYKITSAFFNLQTGAAEGVFETNGWPVGKVLEKDFPEVEKVLYTRSASFLQVNYNDKHFPQKIHFAGPEFFDLFSFELLKGNSQTALTEPYSVVITKAMEEKFFSGQDALNKSITLADSMQFVVTGVLQDIPSNSHIQLDMVLSFSTFEILSPLFGQPFSYDTGWGNINMRNYILLKEGVDVGAFKEKARNVYMDRAAGMLKDWGTEIYLNVEPLNTLYLTSTTGNGMGPLGSLQRVYLVSGIAGFVILLACINFINLSTAQSSHRSKEVGLRKAIGSNRSALIRQFLSESLWITLLACCLAFALTGLVLPMFNLLLGKTYTLSGLLTFPVMVGVVLLIGSITLLAGYYPAILMSAMRPAEVLKGKLQSSTRGVHLRRTLVVFQFTVSISLVLGTLIVIKQLSFMQKQDLGFAKDEILLVNAARVPKSALVGFKNDIKSLVSVQQVSLANAVPGRPGWIGQVAYPEGKSGAEAVSVEYVAVDEEYIDVLGLAVLAGRNFDPSRELDMTEGLVLNEKAVAIMGWASSEEAIGKKITSPSGTPAGVVIGVVKNYHQLGLQHSIGPITMDVNPPFGNLFVIRYKASETKELIESLNALWLKYVDGFEFNYSFLDEEFERQYQAEEKLAQVFFMFAIVTIVIAVMGLVGLVSFMVASRTKEIGIRKVLGANSITIVRLLSKEFLVLVLVGNLVAFPTAWYLMNSWLDGFAYRTAIGASLFVISFLVAIGITVLAVGLQTMRAATADPVHSLRYE